MGCSAVSVHPDTTFVIKHYCGECNQEITFELQRMRVYDSPILSKILVVHENVPGATTIRIDFTGGALCCISWIVLFKKSPPSSATSRAATRLRWLVVMGLPNGSIALPVFDILPPLFLLASQRLFRPSKLVFVESREKGVTSPGPAAPITIPPFSSRACARNTSISPPILLFVFLGDCLLPPSAAYSLSSCSTLCTLSDLCGQKRT